MMQYFKKRTSAFMGNVAQLSDSIFIEHVADVVCYKNLWDIILEMSNFAEYGRGQSLPAMF